MLLLELFFLAWEVVWGKILTVGGDVPWLIDVVFVKIVKNQLIIFLFIVIRQGSFGHCSLPRGKSSCRMEIQGAREGKKGHLAVGSNSSILVYLRKAQLKDLRR